MRYSPSFGMPSPWIYDGFCPGVDFAVAVSGRLGLCHSERAIATEEVSVPASLFSVRFSGTEGLPFRCPARFFVFPLPAPHNFPNPSVSSM